MTDQASQGSVKAFNNLNIWSFLKYVERIYLLVPLSTQMDSDYSDDLC